MDNDSLMFALGRAIRDRDWRSLLALVLAPAAAAAVLFGGFAIVMWVGDQFAYEPTWEWWLSAYLVVGAVLGAIGALFGFIGAWVWCVYEGRFWGFALGWFPAGIAAGLFGILLLFLWGPALVIGLARQ